METDKEEIVTTELHLFYVEGLGFVQAGCLQEGYELKCLDGSKETITGIRVEWLEEAITVYNFEVADYHTYYVGDGDVLVHNKCANPSGDEAKIVPNPNGKKGGTKHQDTIASLRPSKTGGEMIYEVKFDTPGGNKKTRYADAVEISNGQISSIHQVGKASKNGLPVARESRAIEDIMSSPDYNGAPIYFWPYNSDMGPIIYQ